MTHETALALHILGAAGPATGSRLPIEAGPRSILVDCGIIRGFKALRARDRLPFPAPIAGETSIGDA